MIINAKNVNTNLKSWFRFLVLILKSFVQNVMKKMPRDYYLLPVFQSVDILFQTVDHARHGLAFHEPADPAVAGKKSD